MTGDDVIPWIAIGIAALAITVATIALLLMLRQRQSTSVIELPSPEAIATHDDTPVGPITQLSFVQSLDPETFYQAAEASALARAGHQLSGFLADGTTVTVNSVRLLAGRTELIVSASAAGQTLIKDGLATVMRDGGAGLRLPVVTDVKTGKIIEIMKEARGAQRAAQLASLSAVVIGAAHMIAGADIARRLKLMDGKLDRLLAYREIDQAAALERIYTAAKELVAGPLDAARRLELWRLRGELRELRATWRRELQLHLKSIDDPANAPWIRRTFTRTATADRTLYGKITEAQVQLCLVEYALRLDQVLAVESDTWPGFERSLEDELQDLRGVSDLLRDRAALIRGKDAEISVEPMLAGLDQLIDHYAGLLPEKSGALHQDRQLLPCP